MIDWRATLLKQIEEYKEDQRIPLLMQFEWAIAEDRLRIILRVTAEEMTDRIHADGGKISGVTSRGLMTRSINSSEPLSEWHERQIESYLKPLTQNIAWNAEPVNKEIYVFASLTPTGIKEVLKRNDLLCAVIDDRDPAILLAECRGQRWTPRCDGNGRRVYERVRPYFDRLNVA